MAADFEHVSGIQTYLPFLITSNSFFRVRGPMEQNPTPMLLIYNYYFSAPVVHISVSWNKLETLNSNNWKWYPSASHEITAQSAIDNAIIFHLEKCNFGQATHLIPLVWFRKKRFEIEHKRSSTMCLYTKAFWTIKVHWSYWSKLIKSCIKLLVFHYVSRYKQNSA